MPTTTNYGWTTPADTDLVKDGAAAIRTLGSSIDTTTKALNAGTTNGDLDYFTTGTTKARLAIGTNGQVLTSNGTIPTWATPAASIPANSAATVATSQSTSSTSYTDLTTAGPAVTVTTGTKALVIVSYLATDGVNVGQSMGYAVSGATTIAATDTTALFSQVNASFITNFSRASVVTLTAGSNTFTAKYKVVSAGTRSFANRDIFVMNLA
jgi:hypothetical protein